MAAKTLKDFKQAFDPFYAVEGEVLTRLSRKINKARKAVYVVTAAQNATPVHPDWWPILTNIADTRDAHLMVIPLRYKNPTSRWNGSRENADAWAPETREYLWNVRTKLNANLMLLADIKTTPTNTMPIAGMEAISNSLSGIIGHTKMHLKSVATPSNRMAKILTTTGACTVENYSDTRIGAIGEFHHSLSALIVEIDGPYFSIRQLHFDQKTKSCTDLNLRYFYDRVETAPRALALGMGDTHVDFIDPLVYKATFGKDGIIDTTKPRNLIYADLLDGYSCNPHHAGNTFIEYAKYLSGRGDVRAEVERAITFVADNAPSDTLSVVQASNHNDFLSRWVSQPAGKVSVSPLNEVFYLETRLAVLRTVRMGTGGAEYVDAFAHWFRFAGVPNSRVLDLDEPFILADVALDMHGHLGPNGARGSIKNLRRIGTKSIIFHSHSPGIDEGCYQAGTSTRLRLEYNHGASSWLNAHVLLNADGKRQLIIIADGRWRV
jgi:hypothetical protein